MKRNFEPDRITLGADWAWLHPATGECDEWAAGVWNSLGIDPARPVLVINASGDAGSELAAALDILHKDDGFQLAFLCLDCRHPGLHRSVVELVQSFLQAPSVLVPVCP